MFFRPIIKTLNGKDVEIASGDKNEGELANGESSIPPALTPEEIAKIHHQNLKNTALNHLQNDPDAAKDVFTSWIKDIDLKPKEQGDEKVTNEESTEGHK